MPGPAASLPPLEARAIRLLRARRRVRWTGLALSIATLAVLLAGMAWTGGATDHDRYHQRWFKVMEVVAGDELRLGSGSDAFAVKLIGVDAHGSAEAREVARAACGAQVMVYLETVPTRNHAGELLAYVYASDGTLVNAALIDSGWAYADRRWDYSFLRMFLQAEEQAQARRRGMWPGLTEDRMPLWRQRWLAELEKEPWKRQEWRRADEP
jgi:endonuclease YncB( thermonuclease family)